MNLIARPTFIRRWLAILALLFFVSAIYAQAPGVDCVPIQGQGWQGCAPVGNNSAPQTRWADHWGAIATDARNAVLGVAANVSSKDAAQKAAMTDCKAKGGADCKLEIWYINQCAAVTTGDKNYNNATGDTADAAIKKGMETCNNSGELHCHTYFTTCSLPTQVQ